MLKWQALLRGGWIIACLLQPTIASAQYVVDDGNTSPDWVIRGPLTVDLRAERSGIGTGRVYTIEVEGRDAAGNTVRQSVAVRVPLEPSFP